ncbi:tetratricopeptide repeat protein, partial [candidate division WOR-3 bacterium]|nr:tetratricopeptide repeat protein [candidate division WOR-3 bacterium]
AFEKAFTVDTSKTVEWIVKQAEGEKYYYQAFYFYARELFARDEYASVLQYLNYDTLLGIEDINVHVLKGAALYKLERFDEANAEYMRVLEFDPTNPDYNYLIGKSVFDNEDFEGCLPYFADAVKYYKIRYDRLGKVIFQNLVQIDSSLAQEIVVLWVAGKIEELNQLLKEELSFPEGLDVQRANIEQFATVADNLGRSHYFCGIAYYNLKNDTLALENIVSSVYYKPNDPNALYFAGEINVRLSKFSDAIPYLERLTSRCPDDKYAWFYLGVSYTETKQYEKAINVYENKILQLDPENVDVMNNLAYVYRENGDNEKALYWLIRAEETPKQ